MAESSGHGVAVGRWKPALTEEERRFQCLPAAVTSVLGRSLGGLRYRQALPVPSEAKTMAPSPSAADVKARMAKDDRSSGRELWGDIFFEFRKLDVVEISPLVEPCQMTDSSDEEAEEEQLPLKSKSVTGSPVLSLYSLYNRRPPATLAAGAACGGFLLGLQLAIMAGLGHGTPELIGCASSLCAVGGAASTVLSLRGPPNMDCVEMAPWVAVGLSGLCSSLAPLALIPLSPAALLTVAGPIKLAIPGCVGAIVMFEVGHRRWAHIDVSRVQSLGGSHEGCKALDGAETDNFALRVARLWWQHFSPCVPGRVGIGSIYFLGNLAVTYFSVHIDLSLTQWKNGFFNALQSHDSIGFYGHLWDFAPIALASSLAAIYSGYLSTMWDLRWREELTHDYVRMWLDRRAYYLVRFARPGSGSAIDNFDQRLVDDTAIFASSSRGLLCGFAEALLRLVVFFPALVRLAPTPMVWQFCIALSFFSSLVTHLVGKPLAVQNATLQRTEADFRSSLMRLRLFAEDIALQHGEAAEGAGAARYFEGVKAATYMAARGTLNLVAYTSAYGLVGGILPLLVLVPSYFSGSITLGTMFQIESLVGGVRSSLDFFIGAYGEIATWKAASSRMLALEAISMDGAQPDSIRFEEGEDAERLDQDDRLAAEDLKLAGAGGGHVLLEKVSFSWLAGSRIALVGPSGCGKSALLRTLAGAWPPPAAGRISAPGANAAGRQALLVTSKGFLLPVQTTLRKCLAYPEAIAAFDEDLKDALETCGLEHLVDKLSVEADWAADLSQGDRQRLAFARLLARWPVGVKWLFLDDAASGLSEATSLRLHQKLAEQMPQEVGLVVVARHDEISNQCGWHRIRIDPQRKTLIEEPPLEGCARSLRKSALPLADDQPRQFAAPSTGETPGTW